MTTKFLHLDRIGNLDEEAEFELSFANAHPAGHSQKLSNAGVFPEASPDDYDFFERYYPDGLTAHGKNYLYNSPKRSMYALENRSEFLEPNNILDLFASERISDNWAKELVFELVRLEEEIDTFSRFESVFASRNRPELEQWMGFKQVDAEEGNIYSVTAEEYKIRDMTLLDLSGQYSNGLNQAKDLIDQARMYWSGEESDQPVYEALLKPPVQVQAHLKSY